MAEHHDFEPGGLNGTWIWLPEAPPGGVQVGLFRLVVPLPPGSERMRGTVRITAASVYEMFLDGEPVSLGPPRGTPTTYYYDTVAIDRAAGDTLILAVRVAFFADPALRPRSRCDAGRAGLLIEGELVVDDTTVVNVASDARWQCRSDDSFRAVPELVPAAVCHREVIDGGARDRDWRTVASDDGWVPAVVVDDAVEPRNGGHAKPYLLVASPLPALLAEDAGFRPVADPGRAATWRPEAVEQLLGAGTVLAPHSQHVIQLDAARLVTAFPVLRVAGGAGATIAIVAGEAFVQDDGTKHHRDLGQGAILRGNPDEYVVGGWGRREEPEEYRPITFRSFRFVELVIRVADEPLTLLPPTFSITGHPISYESSFVCSDETLNAMWEVSLQTLRSCWHDTIVDCPYYEQLQYVFDARLQAIFMRSLSSDTSLVRKAIHDIHASLQPDGLVLSRSPANVGQVIPSFALHWIHLLAECVVPGGVAEASPSDLEAVARYLPTVEAILGSYLRRIGPDGLLGPAPVHTWPFVDWTVEWEQSAGVPAGGARVPLTAEGLQLVLALRTAADLHAVVGEVDVARRHRTRAAQLVEATVRAAHDPVRRLIADTPGGAGFSQHVQILAVLAEAVPAEAVAEVGASLVSPGADVATVSLAWELFRFRALEILGIARTPQQCWDPWRRQLALGLTTWMEDEVSQRSDCHGWGALPARELLRTVLGVRAAADGSIQIVPGVAHGAWARGTALLPGGAVTVDWAREPESAELRVSLSGLLGRRVTVSTPGGSIELVDVESWAGQLPLA